MRKYECRSELQKCENMRKFRYISDTAIEEFEKKGFIEGPIGSNILNRLRHKYTEYLKMFCSGICISSGRTGSKYGTYDIFGKRVCYYYDIRKEKEFVEHLVKKFYDNNPIPDTEIRKIFTRILHSHKLHWFGCIHSTKIRYNFMIQEKDQKNQKQIIR